MSAGPSAPDIDWDVLRAAARDVVTKAYAPYSHVHVGAAALVDDGRVVRGCNVENASYGLTLCAECGLVADLCATGGGRLVALAVVAGDGAYLAPCGRCRQVLYEFGGPDLLVDTGADRAPTTLGELLPGAFGPDDVASPIRLMATDILEVLRTKRDGGALSDEQIRFFLEGYTAGSIADEQAAALLMAIVFRGLDQRELATWTAEMIASGERLDLSSVGRPTVDKHSTGGVGDKVSLILAPLVAACGAAVPQLSGRGLGHTGGTLDKLESIPGWRATLDNDEVLAVLRDVGAVICAAGDGLAPADRKLYALRDVTATVEAIPLIASSIMSKKIAEGTDALVLDVKVGSGAFLPELGRARELAETMVGLGQAHGVRTVALLTDMEAPLGRAAGNGLEVTESIEVLQGGGPADLREVTLALAREMLSLAGVEADPAEALDDGRAVEVFDRMIRAQGGDPEAPLVQAEFVRTVPAPSAGFVRRLDARAVGVGAWRLGAGRARKEDPVSPSAGIVCLAKPGDEVAEGQPLLDLHADDEDRFDGAVAALAGAIEIGPEPPEPRALVIDRIA